MRDWIEYICMYVNGMVNTFIYETSLSTLHTKCDGIWRKIDGKHIHIKHKMKREKKTMKQRDASARPVDSWLIFTLNVCLPLSSVSRRNTIACHSIRSFKTASSINHLTVAVSFGFFLFTVTAATSTHNK